jgi:Ni/Fe-hydrogenase subunit HybB-like protein
VTAFLGYALVAVALLYDLGKVYNIWHPLIMWNPHSVMFEVAWCVMLYLTVLVITGFLLNRLNVSITGLEYSAHAHYFPKWTELAVTLSMVGTMFLCFALAARYLNVFEAD